MNLSKKLTDNRKKNTKRKITQEAYEQCLERDGGCVICGTNQNLDRPHHVLYGNEAEYSEDRNDISKLVTICKVHHHKLHFEGNNNYREQCKQYLGL